MATTISFASTPISRDELKKFLPNFQLVKAFENMSQDVSVNLPGGITDNTAAIEVAQATAESAIVQATAAQATADAAQADIDAFELREVPLALADGPVIASSALLHNSFSVTLGGNRTLAAPSNLFNGVLLNYAIRQDAAGSRTLAVNAIFDFGAAGTPVMSTTPNAVDYIFGYYDLLSNKILAVFRRQQSQSASFSAHNNGVAQSIPTTVFTKLTFSTEAYDVGSYFAGSTWTPPAGRLVSIKGAVSLPSAATLFAIAVYKNGAEYKRGAMITGPAAGSILLVVSCDDIPNGTDFYELFAFQGSGGAMNTVGLATQTYFQGTSAQT